MFPLLAHLFCLGIELVDPTLIHCHKTSKKIFLVCAAHVQILLTALHAVLLLKRRQQSWHPPCRHFGHVQVVMDDAANRPSADAHLHDDLVEGYPPVGEHNLLHLCNCLVILSSCRPTAA